MAKRKSEVDDDEDVRAVFVDTSLNTHIVLLVSPTDTISLLKQKILLEHPKCFPDFGEIQINALKVKRRECYYHLVDSMFVKTAFYRVAKNWFLFADASSQICMLNHSSDHAVITTGPSKTLPTPVTSSKHLELGINCNEIDRCGNYSDVNKGLGLEMPNKIVSGVHDEFKSAEEALNPENLGSGNNKKNDKKKRKRTREHDDNGEENGERPVDLPLNRVGKDGMKSTNNVDDEVSPSTRAKKKHKVLKKGAEDVSLSKTKTDMQKYRSDDVDDLPTIGDSNHIKKGKKEKKHRSSDLPSPKINKQDVQEGTQSHNQPEGTRTSSDKLINREIENDNVELAPGSRAKKTKKAEKYDKMPDFLENGNAPSQNKNTIHVLKNSVIGSMELGTRAKKGKVKKGKVSIQENTDLPSMEKNKDSATCIGKVENDKNDDLSDIADRDDSTHQTNKKRNRVKTVSIFSQDGDQEADDAREIGAEPLQTAEINKPSVSLEIRSEKAKRKIQKKQTVSMKDSPDFSVKEQSGEKTTEADTLKADDVNLLVDGDLYKDTSKTPLPEISMDVAEVRKTGRHASKKKVKKHDLPSSVDTLCSGHDVVSSKEEVRSGRTSRDGTKLKDGDPEALGTEALQPPSIDKAEENLENMSDKPKKNTRKKRTASNDSPPMSPMKERFDEETREMVVPKTGEATLVDECNEKLDEILPSDSDEILPSDSDGLREVRNQDKPHTTEQVVKKLNLPSSSVDTLSNQSSLNKSKKSKKGERTPENGTQLKESITVQKQDMPPPQPQPSEKPSGTFKVGIETQEPHENDMGIGSPNRKTRQGKKTTTEPQKKPVENPVISTRSTRKKMGEVINNTSPQKKGLLATRGAIFEDESSGSSDDGDKMDGSDCSTRTPSDNLSSSDYSEGESQGNVVTSQHDSLKGGGQDGANSNSLDFKNLTLHTVLRSSSRYKKAKVLASQSQLDDTETPLDVVPDSQANL